jgi:hypothetical protein
MFVGLGWYVIAFPKFLFGAPPMFVGMLASIALLMFGTLWEYRGRITINTKELIGKLGMFLFLTGIISILPTVAYLSTLHTMKLFVPFITMELNVLFLGLMFMTQRKFICSRPVQQ